MFLLENMSTEFVFYSFFRNEITFFEKFIVDNEERIDPKLPISSLNEKNNVIEVALPISNRPQTNLHDDFISTSVGSYRSDIEDENSSFSSENEADSFDGRRRLRDSLKAAQKIIINNKIQQQQPPKVPQSPLNNTGAAYLQQHHQQQTQQQQQPQKTTPTSPLTLQQPQQAIAPQTSSQPQQPKFLPPSAFQAPQQQQQPVQQPTPQAHTQAPRTHKEHKEEGDDQTQEEYGQEERVFVETKKAPPLLPPHLRFTPLNSNVRSATDPSILPTPLHVTVNHVYYATQNNISMIGVSQRYRDKFSTILLYKPSEPSNNIDSLHKVSESSINA